MRLDEIILLRRKKTFLYEVGKKLNIDKKNIGGD